MNPLLLLAIAAAPPPAELRCLPVPPGLARGAPVVMERADARRAGPAHLDEVSLIGLSRDGKVAYVVRPPATRDCAADDGVRRLVVENPLTKVVECEAPLGERPEAAARRALEEAFALEPVRRCCARPECDYCLARDPRTTVPLADYRRAEAFGWSPAPRVAYATTGQVRPPEDAPPECLPALVVKDLVTDRPLLRRPLAELPDLAWAAALKRFGIVEQEVPLHQLHSDRAGFQTSAGTVGFYWGNPRHRGDLTPPPCRVTLSHQARGVKQIAEFGPAEVTSCNAIFPLAAAVSPYEPRAVLFLAVEVPGGRAPGAADRRAEPSARRYRVAVVGAHLEAGFGARQSLDLLARRVDPVAAYLLGAQLRAPGAAVPPGAEAVPALVQALDPAFGAPLCPIIEVLDGFYRDDLGGMAVPLLVATRHQSPGPCAATLAALLDRGVRPADLPGMVAMFRERPDDPVSLELLLRTGGAAPPIVALLQELVSGPVPPELAGQRCRAAEAVRLLAPALQASLPALERLPIPDHACGASEDQPLRERWQQVLAEVRGATPAPIGRLPGLEERALDRPTQEEEAERFHRELEQRGDPDRELDLDPDPEIE